MPGYPHLRKAHYMFGWDWGPKLPDLGLWRGVRLEGYTGGRIRDMHIRQRHEQGRVILSCAADLDIWSEGVTACWEVTAPDGQSWSVPLADGKAELTIREPQLWWVRGLGGQPLYTCRVRLLQAGVEVDAHERRIGLRTLTVSQDRDEWGKKFCFINNGMKVFAMGANYIPEDQLLPRCTPERTARLLEDCEQANYNFIRVWGGGVYPDEAFYDWCDAHGFIVWQDFMFACSAYRLTDGFERTVRQEVVDNVRRLRHHPSLGLWCGNNEIESAWEGWGLPGRRRRRRITCACSRASSRRCSGSTTRRPFTGPPPPRPAAASATPPPTRRATCTIGRSGTASSPSRPSGPSTTASARNTGSKAFPPCPRCAHSRATGRWTCAAA